MLLYESYFVLHCIAFAANWVFAHGIHAISWKEINLRKRSSLRELVINVEFRQNRLNCFENICLLPLACFGALIQQLVLNTTKTTTTRLTDVYPGHPQGPFTLRTSTDVDARQQRPLTRVNVR